jgi:uncharacterized protein
MANEPGMPTWVDLSTSDLPGAVNFYAQLFGWTPVASTEPEARGYTRFMLDGKPVAGASPLMMEEQPTVWTMYVASDDADETAARVMQAGGQVLVRPMDVMAYGRMAVFMDPGGAAFATWQAGEHGGAEVMHQPNSFDWTELMTRDPDDAKEFYYSVFGWTGVGMDVGGTEYTVYNVGENAAGGMMPMTEPMFPAEIPPHWMIYFAVADCDATSAQAEKLGGSVSIPPTEIPPGRFAVLGDPQGAYFAVIKNNPDFGM